MFKSCVRHCLLALGLMASAPAVAMPATDVVVFGDSLVDAGNVQNLATLFMAPDPTPAAAGYVMGRFSNGLNVADLITRAITGAPSTPSFMGGNNFAFGGALATTDGDPIPDLAAQLAMWQFATGGIADADTLFVVAAGGNDVTAIDDMVAGAPSPADVAMALAGTVQALNDAGARRILLANSAGATPTAFAINALLAGELAGLALDPATDLVLFDLQAFGTAVVLAPASVGLPPLTTFSFCLAERAPMPGINCDGFALFDPIHPTKQVHQAAFRALQPAIAQHISEPALALLGLSGLAGVVMVRRRMA